MILQETIDKVFSLDIVEVIMNEGVALKKQGSNFAGLSPFTNEKTPSFMVSPVKQIFKCFSSGIGGNVVQFIKEKQGLNFPEAIKYLANKYSIPILETEKTDEEKQLELQKESIFIINENVAKQYESILKTYPGALDYILNKRNISSEMIDKFNLGFAPSNNIIATFILNNHFDWKLAVESSIVGYKDGNLYDRFVNRIMFPIKNHTGKIVGFGGRYIGTNKNMAKYINTSDTIVYNKSNILYGLYEAKKAITEKGTAYLSEGYLDVISFFKKGIENIVAPCGTAFTSEQASLLKRYAKRVTIIFDSDGPGIKSAFSAGDVLLASGFYVKVLLLPSGQDPDDFVQNKTKEQIEEYIMLNEKDFLMFKADYLMKDKENDLSARSEVISQVLYSLSKIPDAISREVYTKELSSKFGINQNSIREMIKSEQIKEIPETESFISYENSIDLSRVLVKEKCERKIVQFFLCYSEQVFPFTEYVLDQNGNEIVSIVNNTVRGKIQKFIQEDEVVLSNPFYQVILEKAFLVDLRDLNNLRAHLPEDAFLLAQNLKEEEIELNTNSFAEKSDNISEAMKSKIAKSLEETLLYYTSVRALDCIDEEMKKETPDLEMIQAYIAFNVRIKKILNIV